MTVGEAIEKLKALEPDLPLYFEPEVWVASGLPEVRAIEVIDGDGGKFALISDE